MTPNFVVVVNVLQSVCCHIGSGMPNLRIHVFVQDVAVLLGAMTDKWMWKLICGRNEKKSNDEVKFTTKNIKAKLIACDFLVTGIVTNDP